MDVVNEPQNGAASAAVQKRRDDSPTREDLLGQIECLEMEKKHMATIALEQAREEGRNSYRKEALQLLTNAQNDALAEKKKAQKFEKEMKSWKTEAEKKVEELKKKDEELKKKDVELTKKDVELKKKDEELKKKDKELKNKNDEIQSKAEQVAREEAERDQKLEIIMKATQTLFSNSKNDEPLAKLKRRHAECSSDLNQPAVTIDPNNPMASREDSARMPPASEPLDQTPLAKAQLVQVPVVKELDRTLPAKKLSGQAPLRDHDYGGKASGRVDHGVNTGSSRKKYTLLTNVMKPYQVHPVYSSTMQPSSFAEKVGVMLQRMSQNANVKEIYNNFQFGSRKCLWDPNADRTAPQAVELVPKPNKLCTESVFLGEAASETAKKNPVWERNVEKLRNEQNSQLELGIIKFG